MPVGTSERIAACGILRDVSSDSVELVRSQFEAFGRGGLEEVARYWHPDIDWRAVEGAADDVGVMRGPQALRRYYEDWTETFTDLHAEVTEVLAEAGERIAVVVHHRGAAERAGCRSTAATTLSAPSGTARS